MSSARGRLEAHPRERPGVSEAEPPGVQRRPGKAAHRAAGGDRELAMARLAVGRIADDRMAQVLEMHADLMRSSGEKLELDEREACRRGDRAVAGGRGPAVGAHRHALAFRGVAADRGLDRAPQRLRSAVYDRQIALLDPPRGEIRGQRAIGLRRPRHDQHAARSLVEAMHDPGAPGAADTRHLGERSQEAVHQRAGRLPGAGVNGESGGLVQHDEIVVAKKHPQLAGLGFDPRIAALRWIPGDALAGAHEVPGLRAENSVESEVAGTDPLLDLVARQVEVERDGAVEPLARFGLGDAPGARFHGRLRKVSMRMSTRPIEIALSATLKSGQL